MADFGLVEIKDIELRLDRKIRRDRGMVTTSASAPVTVTFSAFYEVQSIQVTPNGPTDARAIYNFDGSGSPPFTTMTVLCFNASGTQIARECSWSVEGI